MTVSVDIEEMAAHLDGRRQADVKEQYDARATHATTAFLLCFFLGFVGAHRFFLGQWRSGFAHLILFALGAAGVAGGFLTKSPVNAALFVIGGLLVLASLIWEVIDLGRIDDEIHRRNLLLAEGLIAGALLSDTSIVETAARKLDEAVHTAAAQSQAAGAPPAMAAMSAGAISADDLAQARQMADQSGRAAISYEAVSTFDVSATPGERAGEHLVFEPATTTERRVNTQPLPTAQDTAPVVETETRTHTVDGYHVTDAQETDRVSGPSAAEVIGGAAALGAAGLGFGLAEAAHTQNHQASAADQYTAPAAAPLAAPPAEQETGPLSAAPADQETGPLVAPAFMEAEQVPAAPPAEPPVLRPASADVTDAGAPAAMEPASDVAFASAYPSFVQLPDQATQPPVAPAGPDAVTQPDIPLYFMPEEAQGVASIQDLPSESGVAQVEPYATPAPQAEPAPSAWDSPTEPVAPAHEHNSLDEVAGFGALAGAGALAADAWAHHEAPPAEPAAFEPAPIEPAPTAPVEPAALAAPKMKRIRVKHRIVVDGQVVREETVEREVPADADMAAEAARIREELEREAASTPDAIARLANLSPDEEVEVRRRVEGLGQQ